MKKDNKQSVKKTSCPTYCKTLTTEMKDQLRPAGLCDCYDKIVKQRATFEEFKKTETKYLEKMNIVINRLTEIEKDLKTKTEVLKTKTDDLKTKAEDLKTKTGHKKATEVLRQRDLKKQTEDLKTKVDDLKYTADLRMKLETFRDISKEMNEYLSKIDDSSLITSKKFDHNFYGLIGLLTNQVLDLHKLTHFDRTDIQARTINESKRKHWEKLEQIYNQKYLENDGMLLQRYVAWPVTRAMQYKMLCQDLEKAAETEVCHERTHEILKGMNELKTMYLTGRYKDFLNFKDITLTFTYDGNSKTRGKIEIKESQIKQVTAFLENGGQFQVTNKLDDLANVFPKVGNCIREITAASAEAAEKNKSCDLVPLIETIPSHGIHDLKVWLKNHKDPVLKKRFDFLSSKEWKKESINFKLYEAGVRILDKM